MMHDAPVPKRRPSGPRRPVVTLVAGLSVVVLGGLAQRDPGKSHGFPPSAGALRGFADVPRARDPGLGAAARAPDRAEHVLSEREASELHAHILDRAPAAAVFFAADLPAGPLRDELLGRSLPAWAAADWPAARAWVGNLPDFDLRRTSLLHLVHHWSCAAPGELLDFAAGLDPAHAQFQSAAVARVADHDPVTAFDWAVRLAGPARESLVVAVATVWAASAPRDVLARLDALPADATRNAGMLAALSTWAQRDAPAAALWVGELPAGPLRDAAVDELDFQCRTARQHDPAVWLATAVAPGRAHASDFFPVSSPP
jgi:hypothetical protein